MQLIDLCAPGDDALENVGQIMPRVDICSLAELMSDARMAHVSAPPSLPANKWFFFPSPIGLMVRSTVLLSISMRPSSMKRVRPSQWLKV
ncbi:hypothetical protein AB7M49_004069 [Bradyrhizobium elkanii]